MENRSRWHPPAEPMERCKNQLGHLIAGHFDTSGMECTVVTAPGIVPRVRANENFRIPDLAVTCTRYETEEYDVAEPVLIVEILSPSNRAETWQNVWSFTTIPSLREVLLLSTTAVRAELLRRGSDGSWPAAATVIEDGELILDSIGFTIPLAAIYRTTRLRAGVTRRSGRNLRKSAAGSMTGARRGWFDWCGVWSGWRHSRDRPPRRFLKGAHERMPLGW